MAVNTLLVKAYATTVYRTGRNSLVNIEATRPEYVAPVMQHVASTFYIEDIDYALTNAYITPAEHADTLSLKGVDDPQNQPVVDSATTEVLAE